MSITFNFISHIYKKFTPVRARSRRPPDLGRTAAGHGQPLPYRNLSPRVGGGSYVSPLKQHITCDK